MRLLSLVYVKYTKVIHLLFTNLEKFALNIKIKA